MPIGANYSCEEQLGSGVGMSGITEACTTDKISRSQALVVESSLEVSSWQAGGVLQTDLTSSMTAVPRTCLPPESVDSRLDDVLILSLELDDGLRLLSSSSDVCSNLRSDLSETPLCCCSCTGPGSTVWVGRLLSSNDGEVLSVASSVACDDPQATPPTR